MDITLQKHPPQFQISKPRGFRVSPVSRSPLSRRTAHWVPTAPMSWYLGPRSGWERWERWKDGRWIYIYIYNTCILYVFIYKYIDSVDMFDVWKYQHDNHQGRWTLYKQRCLRNPLLFMTFLPPFHLTHEKSYI